MSSETSVDDAIVGRKLDETHLELEFLSFLFLLSLDVCVYRA